MHWFKTYLNGTEADKHSVLAVALRVEHNIHA